MKLNYKTAMFDIDAKDGHVPIINSTSSESLENKYSKVDNLKLGRKYIAFISSLRGAKVRLNRSEAFLHVKQLSGVLDNVIFKFTINEDLTINVEQTEGDICNPDQINRLVNDLDSFRTLPYTEKYILGDIEFKDVNGDLCYIEVEQLRPFDILRSILDDVQEDTSVDVLKDVKDYSRINSLIDLLCDKEIFPDQK